jgi:hypothetical protein
VAKAEQVRHLTSHRVQIGFGRAGRGKYPSEHFKHENNAAVITHYVQSKVYVMQVTQSWAPTSMKLALHTQAPFISYLLSNGLHKVQLVDRLFMQSTQLT